MNANARRHTRPITAIRVSDRHGRTDCVRTGNARGRRGWCPARVSLILALAATSATLVPRALPAQLPADFEDAWTSLVAEHRRTLKAEGVVGATLAVVHNGEIVAADYFGMEDLETGRRVDEHTIYHWASITKTFTGVGVMQLRDRGLLELDDAIVDYVPELRDVHNPFGSMEEITLRQLMSHSAGFRGPSWPWGGDETWHPHEPTKWAQLVAMIPYTRILFPPGSQHSYSNPGIIFLGRTLEELTGDVYEAYIDKNIFEPLDMDSSYFDVTPWHLLDDRSNNYQIVEGQPVANGLDFNTGITVSNGGLNAPVTDMAKWLAFLMGAPAARQAAYEQVLTRTSLEEMWRQVVPVADSSALGPVGMGLSFFLYERAGHRVVGHTGSQKSFRSFILLDPEADVGVIAAYNTAGGDETAPDVERIREETQSRALEALFPLFWGERVSVQGSAESTATHTSRRPHSPSGSAVGERRVKCELLPYEVPANARTPRR